MDFEAQIDLNNYTKIDKIGQGQTGKVFRIKDNKTGTVYAAKISSRPLASNSKTENTNLLRELNIMAKIDHPNIVKFIGYSPSDFNGKDKPVIVTELLTNGTLADVIEKERKSLSLSLWDDTRKLISIYGIAAAMKFLHSHGIIHRDLKPANILMNESLYPKVADFGLSKNIDSQDTLNVQSTISPKGTPIYMAPEIYLNSNYTPAVDVYAFAMIVYEIMSNEVPFKGYEIFRIYNEVTNKKRPKMPKSIPKAYQIFIECCWEQEPDDRPTFDQIVEVLKSNKGFITDLVDVGEYLDYIDYVEEYQASYDKNIKIRSLDERKQSRKEKIKEEENNKEQVTRPRSNTAKPNEKPLIDEIENKNQKITIHDKISMFNSIKIMGAPADQNKVLQPEPQKKQDAIPPKVAKGINEKKAIFESSLIQQNANDNQNKEHKFQLRNNDSHNSNRYEVKSTSSVTSSSMVSKRESPLAVSNEKKIPDNETKKETTTSNRNSTNYNKYKESLNQKIAMFNNPHGSAGNIPPFKKDST